MQYMLDAQLTTSPFLHDVALVASYVVLHSQLQTIEMQKFLVSPDLHSTNQFLSVVFSM